MSTNAAIAGPLVDTIQPFTIHHIAGRDQSFSVWRNGVLYCFFADLEAATTYCLNKGRSKP